MRVMSAYDPKRTFSPRPERSSVAALPGFAGALSTAVHCGGKSFSFRPLDDDETSGIFKRKIQSANQWSSDLSHPSPSGTAG